MILRLDDSGVLLGDQRLTPLNALGKIIANMPKATDRHVRFLNMYKQMGPMFYLKLGYLYEYLEWYLDQVGSVELSKADFSDEGAFYRYDDPGYFQDTADNILKTYSVAYVVNDLDILNLSISDKSIMVVGKTTGTFEKVKFGEFKSKDDIVNFETHSENHIRVDIDSPKTAKKTKKPSKKSAKPTTKKTKKTTKKKTKPTAKKTSRKSKK